MVFKSNWEKLPFLRVALLIVAGIVCAQYVPAGAFYMGAFAISVVSYLWLHRLVMRNVRATNLLYVAVTACAYVAFFSFGAMRMWQTEPREHLSVYVPDSLVKAYEASVISPIKQNAKGNGSLTAQAVRVKTAKGWFPANAKVQLSIQAADSQKLSYGGRLLIAGRPQLIEPPKNPDGFNYQQLMRNKGIVYQHFVRDKQWEVLSHQASFSLQGMAWNLQQWADHTLENAMNSPVEAGLASALIVGLKDELDDTLLRAYSATGIMHVLAVSGLHVGILFAILSLLLKPLQGHSLGKYAFVGIVLTVLWGYALITGLSPSVMRATLMFSLLNIGQLFAQRNSSFNTLALSAVILLAYNPLMLFQVGFQLSYVAVAGIMYFYPRFYRLWEAPYWLADKIWSVVCVSAAAQLATFPLSMYYFHQFPNYFLLSNLFAIPLAFLILSFGLGVLAFSWMSFAPKLLGLALKWLVWLNNYMAFTVESLPFSASKTLYISNVELAAIYVVIVSMAAFFAQRQRLWLVSALTGTLVISISKIAERQQQQNERLLAIFHTPRHSSVLWIAQQDVLLQADSALMAKPQQIRSTFANFLFKKGIDWEKIPASHFSHTEVPIAMREYAGNLLYRKNGASLFYLNQPIRNPVIPPCDVLLIANHAIHSLKNLPREQLQAVRYIVLDGSGNNRLARRLKQEASQLGIACHAVAIDGAFLWKY